MGTPPEFTGPLNLGNPVESTIREIAEMIIALTGSSSKIMFMPLPTDDPRQRRPDISMATEVLGWRPKVELEAGLVRTIAYFDALLARQRGQEIPTLPTHAAVRRGKLRTPRDLKRAV